MSEPQRRTKPPPLQPLHHSMIPLLDSKYIEYHNEYIQYTPPIYTVPWNPAYRSRKSRSQGITKPLEVGKVQDYELTNTNCRTYTPPGEMQKWGWPLYITFHGGVGVRRNRFRCLIRNPDVHANCVVMSVNYRHAPEHPYPAAVEDAIDSLQWVVKHGKDKLDVDMTRIAIGGISAGGNLAAVLALKAPTITPPLPHPLIFQLLIVPSTDQTSTTTSPSPPYEYAPFPNLEALLWFRNIYLPDKANHSDWQASPILAPEGVLSVAPKAWVAVAEVDILRDEAERYVEKLESAGVSAMVVCYEKMPHIFTALDDVLGGGKRFVQDAGEALREAFWGS